MNDRTMWTSAWTPVASTARWMLNLLTAPIMWDLLLPDLQLALFALP